MIEKIYKKILGQSCNNETSMYAFIPKLVDPTAGIMICAKANRDMIVHNLFSQTY